jgi:hypothetical protein
MIQLEEFVLQVIQVGELFTSHSDGIKHEISILETHSLSR